MRTLQFNIIADSRFQTDENTYFTVSVTHTKAKGIYPKGMLARIAKSKKTGNTVIQAILIPIKDKQ